MCQCNVKSFQVPKCAWTKLGKYNVSTTEHFQFVYNCLEISGNELPATTEVGVNLPNNTPKPTTANTTASPSKAPSNAGTDYCTVQQLNVFSTALETASSGCLSNTSYSWGDNKYPTKTQYSEICKCTSVSEFTIPDCSIQKGSNSVALSVHYDWVTSAQCSTYSPPGLCPIVLF